MWACVCGLVLLFSWGPEIPKSPHEDSKTRKNVPRPHENKGHFNLRVKGYS